MKKRNWLLTGIGSIILGIISSAIYDLIKTKPLLTTFWGFILDIWNVVISFFQIEIKVWIILLVSLVIIFLKEIYKNKTPNYPSYITYTKDRFKNWLWQWEWFYDSSQKKWIISRLQPFCPKCDVELLNKSDIREQRAYCPKCQRIYSDYDGNIDDSEGIKVLIYDNVKKNNY